MIVSPERRAFRKRLGAELAALRSARKESQVDIAGWLGVNDETVGRWERGEREPKAFELHRLAARYEADPGWLLREVQ